ncbi:hypothetical protein IIA79_05555 [bacterium]|nr:hypothetical protein [bacterium]
MKKVTAAAVALVVLLWSTLAYAQSYAALADEEHGPYLGVGGLFFSQDSVDGNGDETVTTVSLSGLSHYLAWQIFYGFGDGDANAYGGSLDYIFASSFGNSDSFLNPSKEMWWFGVGPSIIAMQNLFLSGVESGEGISVGGTDTELGGNLGFGYMWHTWGMSVYAHYLFGPEMLVWQAMLLYTIR